MIVSVARDVPKDFNAVRLLIKSISRLRKITCLQPDVCLLNTTKLFIGAATTTEHSFDYFSVTPLKLQKN